MTSTYLRADQSFDCQILYPVYLLLSKVHFTDLIKGQQHFTVIQIAGILWIKANIIITIIHKWSPGMRYLPRIPFLFVSLLFWFLYRFHFKRTFGLCSTHEMWKDLGLLEQKIESFGPVVILDTRSICSFICCWYRFLSYIQVLFWLSNENFKFPMFSI